MNLLRVLTSTVLWQNGFSLTCGSVQGLDGLFYCAAFSHRRCSDKLFEFLVKKLKSGRVQSFDVTIPVHIWRNTFMQLILECEEIDVASTGNHIVWMKSKLKFPALNGKLDRFCGSYQCYAIKEGSCNIRIHSAHHCQLCIICGTSYSIDKCCFEGEKSINFTIILYFQHFFTTVDVNKSLRGDAFTESWYYTWKLWNMKILFIKSSRLF